MNQNKTEANAQTAAIAVGSGALLGIMARVFDVPKENVTESSDSKKSFVIAANDLKGREIMSIIMRAANMTFQEIGDVLGVTKERIRQSEAKAIRKLRHPKRAGIMVKYVRFDA